MKIRRFTFVWNADFNLSGGLNALKEVWRGKHTCVLCAIAFHRVTQTREWKDYKAYLSKRFNADIREPCRNQLSKAEYEAVKRDYPAVLAQTDNGIIKLLGGDAIESCGNYFSAFKQLLDREIENRIKESDDASI